MLLSVPAIFFRYSADDAIKDFVLRLAEGPQTHRFTLIPCWAMDGILQMEDSIFGFH